MVTTISSLDRYRGCLLGGAVGDALGAAVEFETIDAIRARFGDDGILEPASAYGRVGAITDDTQMTLFTAEGLLLADDRLERGIGNPPGMLWMAYQRWLLTQGEQASGPHLDRGELVGMPELRSRRAPGNTCLSALRIAREENLAATAANDSKGCGGVMRAAPCGLVNWVPAGAPFRMGTASAALTHGHPSGSLAAGALAEIVAAIVGGAELDAAVADAIAMVDEESGGEEVSQALRAALEPGAGVEALGAGWVAEECLAIAVFSVLTHPDDFAAAVRLAANHSGDSDSTAAVAGNIAGALLGVSAIPWRWLDTLELRDTIDRLATALYERFVLGKRQVCWRRGTAKPLNDLYWVTPQLLAGPYPGARGDGEAAGKLGELLELGVTFFLDLTEEGELEPYAHVLDGRATHTRAPIRDVTVPVDPPMDEIQRVLQAALDSGERVYLHCWGGVGRTGTVIGCHLAGQGVGEPLARLQELRAHTLRARRRSPETEAQSRVVAGWPQSPA